MNARQPNPASTPSEIRKTKAPFLVSHRWRWISWTHPHGNKHAAILEKARELGASRWDFGQAEHTICA